MDSRAGCVSPACSSASGDSTASNREEATGDLRDELVVGIGHGFEQLLDPWRPTGATMPNSAK